MRIRCKRVQRGWGRAYTSGRQQAEGRGAAVAHQNCHPTCGRLSLSPCLEELQPGLRLGCWLPILLMNVRGDKGWRCLRIAGGEEFRARNGSGIHVKLRLF